jgi:hypothetical protein
MSAGELVGLKRDNLNLLKREVRIVGSLKEGQWWPALCRRDEDERLPAHTLDPALFGRGAGPPSTANAQERLRLHRCKGSTVATVELPQTLLEAGGQQGRARLTAPLPRSPRCATRRCVNGRDERPATGLSQQAAEAGGSLTLEAQGRVGAAPTTTGRVDTARRPGSGKRGRKA